MAKRRKTNRPPEIRNREEHMRMVKFLAGVIEGVYHQLDIPLPLGIAAALLVAVEATDHGDADLRAGTIETLERLLVQLKTKQASATMAPEPSQTM